MQDVLRRHPLSGERSGERDWQWWMGLEYFDRARNKDEGIELPDGYYEKAWR
jgi:hypothetical protein